MPKATLDLNPNQLTMVEEAMVGLGFDSITNTDTDCSQAYKVECLQEAWCTSLSSA
jgi:hypothetical protein